MSATQEFELGGIGQIHIGVKQIGRAVVFYRDVLGLNLLFEVPDQAMAFFDCGGVRLYLGEAAFDEFPSNPLIYYRVSDVQYAHQVLKSRGVEFEREPHIVHKTADHELWMAGFRDPEGNFIHLMSEASV